MRVFAIAVVLGVAAAVAAQWLASYEVPCLAEDDGEERVVACIEPNHNPNVELSIAGASTGERALLVECDSNALLMAMSCCEGAECSTERLLRVIPVPEMAPAFPVLAALLGVAFALRRPSSVE